MKKILTELRAYLRGLHYDEKKLINQFKLTDELIIDLSPPILDRHVKQYNKKIMTTKL